MTATESADKVLSSPVEEDAYALIQAGLALSRALGGGDKDAIQAALDTNLKLWVGIRTMVSRPDHPLPAEVRENLIRLSQYTVQKTFELAQTHSAETVNSLINTNLQIAEGLLEGTRTSG